jgi:cytochrome c553
MRPRLLRPLVVVAAIAVATSLAACGGSKSPASAAAAERSNEQQDEAKLAKFAKCMREHGVEASTSKGPDGHGFGLQIKGKAGAGRVAMEAAQRACKRYQPQPKKVNLSPQEKVAQEEAVTKFAKCMREHGVDVHASTSNGRVQLQVGGPGSSGGPNPESPAFQAAQKACQSLLPFRKGGPGPGAPRTSNSPDAGGPGSGARLGVGG